jgi:FixJ family two-component response regulator
MLPNAVRGRMGIKTTARTIQPIVFVVDDDPLVRRSLDALIGSVGLQVKAFSNAREFLRCERPMVPSCLVLDVRLPGVSGLDLQRELVARNESIPIVFITGHGDVPMSVRAMKGGAVEFLTKPFHEQELIDAVQHSIEMNRRTLKVHGEMAELRGRGDRLTPREREVIGYVVAGLLNKQIAARLGTKEITVKIQRANAMKKLKAASLPELVRMADKLGIGKPIESPLREPRWPA